MDVALYLLLTTNYFIFKLIMLIKSGILSKNHVSCKLIYAKILHHIFISTIYENFKSVFFSNLEQKEISKLVYLFDLSN